MAQGTRTKLIKIGNSQGIRIPKSVVEQLHLSDEIEMVVKEDHLELRPCRETRAGWAEAFRQMAENGDDKLLEEPTPTRWDEEEWEW